jgi:hypothetical protein
MLRDHDLQLLHSLKHSMGCDLPGIKRLVELVFDRAQTTSKGKGVAQKCIPAPCQTRVSTSGPEVHACASTQGDPADRQLHVVDTSKASITCDLPCVLKLGEAARRCTRRNGRNQADAGGTAAVSSKRHSEEILTTPASSSKRPKLKDKCADWAVIVVRAHSAYGSMCVLEDITRPADCLAPHMSFGFKCPRVVCFASCWKAQICDTGLVKLLLL